MPTPSTPSYKVAKTPNKGFGLFSTRFIPIGELILSEKQLFASSDQDSGLIGETTGKLDDKGKASFYSLHDGIRVNDPKPGPDPDPTLFLSNAFPLGPPGTLGRANAIFPTCSRINHSCLPNIHHVWNPYTLCEDIYALKNISEGEELATTYVPVLRSLIDRQTLLKGLHFACQCSYCTSPPNPISDASRERIHLLDGMIARVVSINPTIDLRFCKERLRLLEKEGSFLSEESRTHYSAVVACIIRSDIRQAKRHAGMDYAFRLLCSGVENKETQDALRVYVAPERHEFLGVAGRVEMPMICDSCGKEGLGKGEEVECGECFCAIYCSKGCLKAHEIHHDAVCDVLTGKRWLVGNEGYEGILKHGWDCLREM